MQELENEIEYVEGYEDLAEEDDIEDFGGLAIDKSSTDIDTGIALIKFSMCSFIKLFLVDLIFFCGVRIGGSRNSFFIYYKY